MKVIDFFEGVYRPLRLRSRSLNTLRLYRYSIKLFSETLGHEATLEDFTDETVCRHLMALADLGYAPHSIDKERSQLLAMWNLAARKGLVGVFPDVPRDPLPEIVPMAWMQHELVALIRSCRQEVGRIGGVQSALWWTALHEVAWDSGERIGALMRIRWQDLSDDGWLRVPAEVRKGKRADKLFKLSEQTMQSLRLMQLPRRELIFAWDRSWNLIYSHYERILKRAGLPTDARSKFHRMRRSVASHYKANGGDATELLGHSDSRVTKKYLDPRIVQTAQPADVLFRIG
jgi:integrase